MSGAIVVGVLVVVVAFVAGVGKSVENSAGNWLPDVLNLTGPLVTGTAENVLLGVVLNGLKVTVG